LGQCHQIDNNNRCFILGLRRVARKHGPQGGDGNCVEQDGPHHHARAGPAHGLGLQTCRARGFRLAVYVIGELQKTSIRISQ
jgi:hypothetical protein